MKRRGLRSDAELLGTVEQILLREVLSFDGPKRVGLRIEGRWPDRSVFATAVLESCASLAVARVYETELDRDPERALQIVYMATDDLDLVRTVAAPVPVRRSDA